MIGAACVASSQEVSHPYLPVDEAGAEPLLIATRSAIIEALVVKDRAQLERWVAPAVNGSESERGVMLDRISAWQETAGELGDALAHGGAFTDAQKTRFCAPYWAARPPGTVELPDRLVFEGLPWAVVVPRAPVRSRADAAAPEIGELSLELVQVLPNEPADLAHRLLAIAYGRGRGYVFREDVREIDGATQACFEKSKQWMLTTFR
jgi:hypothetical protein